MKYSERLEEIKEKYSEVTVLEYINDVEVIGVDIKDLVWLIKQTERIEELEEKVKQYEKALAGFNKEFNFEYRWQKSNVKRNPKSQWQRGALEGFEHVKRIYDKHVEVQNG